MRATNRPIPRLPVFGWETFTGPKESAVPCVLDTPRLAFTTSGRASIYQALKILGISNGDAVIVPTYHCPTMVAPIVALGATPIFCPIDATGRIDATALMQLATPTTRAIIAPHFFGLPQPMNELRAWCDSRKVALIEDCAHALFGIAGERNVGRWGDLAIASLTKFLPLPEGGCLICNTDQVDYVALKRHGITNQIRAFLDVIEEGVRHHAMTGLNGILRGIFGLKHILKPTQLPSPLPPATDTSNNGPDQQIDHRLADTQLALACRWVVNHATRERIVSNRRRNYRYLSKALAGSPGFHPLVPALPDNCAPYVFPLWVARPDPAYQQLLSRGIPLFRWDRLWPTTPTLVNDNGLSWSHHVFQVVCHQDLQPDELDRIVASLRELCP